MASDCQSQCSFKTKYPYFMLGLSTLETRGLIFSPTFQARDLFPAAKLLSFLMFPLFLISGGFCIYYSTLHETS